MVGKLSSGTQSIIAENVLTGQRACLEVPVEESLKEIAERYRERFNAHAGSYTWKYLSKVLRTDRTLSENGVFPETLNMQKWVPVLQLYFNDDLTEA